MGWVVMGQFFVIIEVMFMVLFHLFLKFLVLYVCCYGGVAVIKVIELASVRD